MSEPDKSDSPADRMRNSAGSGADDVEEQLWTGGYSGKAMFGSWISAVLITVIIAIGAFYVIEFSSAVMIVLGAAALIWGYLLIVLAYRKFSVSYELTTQRFIHKAGILTQRTDRIEVIDMDDVTYVQGIVQRMLNVGSIYIKSSDSSHPELVLRGIDDVAKIADTIDDVRRTERRRRGLHIEAI